MYDYHAELIGHINLVLLWSIVFSVIVLIFYSTIKEYFELRRGRALLKIKQNVYELFLSSPKNGKKIYSDIAAKSSPQQFLDVITNRNREIVFFNDSEQQLLKNSFISEDTIKRIIKIAKKSLNKWHRIEAILSLGYIGMASSLDVLKETVLSKDDDVSYFSVIALGQIKNLTSAKILLKVLKEKPFLRYKIISILESFPREISEETAKLLDNKDSDIRVLALRLLMKFNASGYIKKIIQLTNDSAVEVCAAACDCLGVMADKEEKDSLIKCLKNNSWLVKAHAVTALSNLLGGDSIPLVIDIINDGSLSVLASIKNVFVKNISAALPYMKKLYEGKDEFVKKIILEVLNETGYSLK